MATADVQMWEIGQGYQRLLLWSSEYSWLSYRHSMTKAAPRGEQLNKISCQITQNKVFSCHDWLTTHSTIWYPRFVEALKLCVSLNRTSRISTVDQLNKSMRLAWLRMTWISPKCVIILMTIRLKSQVLLSLIRLVFLLFGGKVRIGNRTLQIMRCANKKADR